MSVVVSQTTQVTPNSFVLILDITGLTELNNCGIFETYATISIKNGVNISTFSRLKKVFDTMSHATKEIKEMIKIHKQRRERLFSNSRKFSVNETFNDLPIQGEGETIFKSNSPVSLSDLKKGK